MASRDRPVHVSCTIQASQSNAHFSLWGIPIPAFTTALSFFDGYRTEVLPANLIQAQRDFFGGT